METGVFTHPFMYWVGMDTDPRTSPEALAEFNRFYSTTHVGEVIAAHPGFVSVGRYELLEPDLRGGVHAGPRWLASYEMKDEAAAEQYVKDNARPWLHRKQYSPWPPARKRAKTVWRMLWRQISVSGSADQPPESIFLVGMNEPPEVTRGDGDARVTCFELYREFAHPAPGCPRFCVIYERADIATVARVEPGGNDTIWRLVYRRIPLPGQAEN
jgi:hypothetical protein